MSAVYIAVTTWLVVAIVAIGVVRFIKGATFEAEEDVPPCVLWPICAMLLVPIGTGWVLFYWMPIRCADAIRVVQGRRLLRKKPHRVIEHSLNSPPDWR